jgi:hypothetical protein
MHRSRVVSQVGVIHYNNYIVTDESARCTIPLGKPDGEGGRRTRELTDLLVDELELGVLWDEYGLVGDVVVNSLLCLCFVFCIS